jgi:hypothetical protein
MEYMDICGTKNYEQNGEKKSKLLTAGTLRVVNGPKVFGYIEMNDNPNVPLVVFQPKKKDAGQDEVNF